MVKKKAAAAPKKKGATKRTAGKRAPRKRSDGGGTARATATRPSSPAADSRDEIGRIDRELLGMIQKRAKLVERLGMLVRSAGGLEAPNIEEEIAPVVAQSRGPLPKQVVRAIFRELVSGCSSLVRPLRIALLGPLYSYSHLAAIERFGQNVEFVPVGSIAAVFEALGPPGRALRRLTDRQARTRLAGFRHRYVTGDDVAGLLAGARRAVAAHGSLGAAFAAGLAPGDADVVPALARFAALLHGGRKNYLLPDPALGSACKRWMLYLRWMVREDAVDLGLWQGVSPALLVVPLDTHMHRVALRLGLTARKTPDLRAARETTAAFRLVRPDDPVRYDFALTRLGIRRDRQSDAFFAACAGGQGTVR